MTFGVWEAYPTPGSGAGAVRASWASHYIAQAEESQPWAEIVGSFRRDFPAMPAAVVTTFVGLGALNSGGYDSSIAKPVVEAGFHCLTEAYMSESPNWTPERLDWTAKTHLGFPVTQPTIGLWNGRLGRITAEQYINEYNLAAFPGYWVWLAETMTQRDLDVLRDFNGR